MLIYRPGSRHRGRVANSGLRRSFYIRRLIAAAVRRLPVNIAPTRRLYQRHCCAARGAAPYAGSRGTASIRRSLRQPALEPDGGRHRGGVRGPSRGFRQDHPAPRRFERDWQERPTTRAERLDLYSTFIDRIEREVRAALAERVTDAIVWAGTKAVYSGLIAGREDWELAETFFNSVTRRIFTTLGVNPDVEFVDSDFEAPSIEAADRLCRSYQPIDDIAALIEAVLGDFSWDAPYADPRRDAARRRPDRRPPGPPGSVTGT